MHNLKEKYHLERISKFPSITKEKLINDYQKGLSLEDIAKSIGCSRTMISNEFTYHNIPKRERYKRTEYFKLKKAGENSHLWKGGRLNGKTVGKEGSLAEKQRIRKKQLIIKHGRCEWCTTKEGLEVHHVIPFIFGKSNDELLLLCQSCHKKAEWLFRSLAGQYFVDNGAPNLYNELAKLKQSIN
jgi:hypothetical protein